ncbi:putative zinc-binding protein [Undibacterium baiyunense]|uniref:Zinc-binding protein n=1 Tax=Undibacterium baiyunense TaxID=2828731 RepID=A0A941DAS9_9BURK|nr:putative zinc-binding protein [Undibacterium baiyunense]MBR7745198.1 zinc-binding protein [Undibacterium baiyunense]
MLEQLPLVYSCSGCSSVAQLANDCALELDRAGRAQMSCISGVGGGVPSLQKLAQSGRPILALDGCALACVKACLAQAGITATVHLILNQEGARKRFHVDAQPEERALIARVVNQGLLEVYRLSELENEQI